MRDLIKFHICLTTKNMKGGTIVKTSLTNKNSDSSCEISYMSHYKKYEMWHYLLNTFIILEILISFMKFLICAVK